MLVVDVQEKLVAAVQEPSDWLVRLEILVKGASLLGVPIVVTEQVPAKLGKTVPAVLEAAGRKVISTDLVDRGYGAARRDFLLEQELLAPAIVTNPPFKLADSFVAKAFDFGANYVAIFQRLAFLEGARRHQCLYKNNPPTRVWVFSKRLTLWRGDEESPGKGGAIPFAWFVWQRPAGGAGTHLGWI